jgi:hypothetical protein
LCLDLFASTLPAPFVLLFVLVNSLFERFGSLAALPCFSDLLFHLAEASGCI